MATYADTYLIPEVTKHLNMLTKENIQKMFELREKRGKALFSVRMFTGVRGRGLGDENDVSVLLPL